jgi:hypothetical protein
MIYADGQLHSCDRQNSRRTSTPVTRHCCCPPGSVLRILLLMPTQGEATSSSLPTQRSRQNRRAHEHPRVTLRRCGGQWHENHLTSTERQAGQDYLRMTRDPLGTKARLPDRFANVATTLLSDSTLMERFRRTGELDARRCSRFIYGTLIMYSAKVRT